MLSSIVLNTHCMYIACSYRHNFVYVHYSVAVYYYSIAVEQIYKGWCICRIMDKWINNYGSTDHVILFLPSGREGRALFHSWNWGR